MMKTDRECELAKQSLAKMDELYRTQLKDLLARGLSEEQAKSSLSSSWTYAMQCKEEIELYEKLKAGHLPPPEHFSTKGKYFVAARIALGMTQRDLAEKLGAKESAVSRDERNEYHGMSADKQDRVAAALNAKVELHACSA